MTMKPDAAQRASEIVGRNVFGGALDTDKRRAMHLEVRNKFHEDALAVDAPLLQQGIAAAITAERADVLDGVRKVLLTVLDSFDGQPVKKEAIVYALTLLNAMFSDFDWTGRTKTQQGVASGAATSMTPLDMSEDVRQARLKTLQQIANLVTLHWHNNKDKMGTVMHGEEKAYYKGHMHAAQILRGMLDSMIIAMIRDAEAPTMDARLALLREIAGSIGVAAAPSTANAPAFNITAPK